MRVLKKHNINFIGWGECGVLDEISSEYRNLTGRTTFTGKSPADRHIAILNRLDHDNRFTKSYARCCDRNGRGNRWVRFFEIKEVIE
ncbi:MAG: hypothetical protein PHW73_10370 [Atribacterota bacterium]|nr:hypothetical protein [Atribacterota bacterium]